uniref:Lipoprotein n=1 Tax=uncultured bacterium FLS12 TaxID=651659 RepID=C5HLA9_9BACT|nr:hypothetical protein LNTAR_22624 [uncultured bacterium FLS12]
MIRDASIVGVAVLFLASGCATGSPPTVYAIEHIETTPHADPVDLTVVGVLDWVKWEGVDADNDTVRKRATDRVDLIGPWSQVTVDGFTNGSRGDFGVAFTWRDGTPVREGESRFLVKSAPFAQGNAKNGSGLDVDEGWTFSVRAPAPGRYVLNLYVQGWGMNYKVGARTSNGEPHTVAGAFPNAPENHVVQVVFTAGARADEVHVSFVSAGVREGRHMTRGMAIKAAALAPLPW